MLPITSAPHCFFCAAPWWQLQRTLRTTVQILVVLAVIVCYCPRKFHTPMSIIRILHFELLGFLYALAAVVAFQLLTGRINLAGVMSQKDPNNPDQTSPERVQLLLATIA